MKRKGYAAPILVAVLLCAYYLGLITAFVMIPALTWWIRVLLCIIPAALGGVVLYVLIQRIREIRSGENDDLDQY
ncbi:MAG: hypothetical protein IJC71_02515 [Clostridia bacterium]|nr:hypothetical protein [Clostridia bacterium]